MQGSYNLSCVGPNLLQTTNVDTIAADAPDPAITSPSASMDFTMYNWQLSLRVNQ